jgi:hypothetical protein
MQPQKDEARGWPNEPVQTEPPQKHRLTTRRTFIRAGVAIGAGLVASSYVKPNLQTIKIPRAFASASAPPIEAIQNGCTPGFWKNHGDLWDVTGFQTTDSFNYTFAVRAFNPDRTLFQALKAGGGGANALGRQAVAALLNASALGAASFGLSVHQVKQLVQNAFAPGGDIEGTKNRFDSLNESACPLESWVR